MGLPPALASSLEAEEGDITPLQTSLWAEARAGGDLLVEASSGPAATTAIAVLSLVSVVDALASAEAAIPLYLRRRSPSYSGLAFNKIVSNVFGSGRGGKKPAAAAEEEGGDAAGGGAPPRGPKPQLHALVLTKNREIAAGVADALRRLGKGCVPDLAVATLVGGVAVAENAKTLEGGCHIAVGTPGRVKFLMEKGVLLVETARLLVLESADWLMAPVFLQDVKRVVGNFPQEKQVVACATVEPPQQMEEDLCSILGIPAMKRLDAGGAVLESRVQMPPNPLPSPSARSSASAAASCFVPYAGADAEAGGALDTAAGTDADRIDGAPSRPPSSSSGERIAGEGKGGRGAGTGTGGGAGGRRPRSMTRGTTAAAARAAAAEEASAAAAEAQAPHARPTQYAIVAVASAKERLLLETRRALSISGRTCAEPAGRRAPPAAVAAQPPRRRAMTSDAVTVAAAPALAPGTTAATAAAAAAAASPVAAWEDAAAAAAAAAANRHGHSGRGLRRPLSGTPDRVPPPAYSLVSKGVFQATSTAAAVPSCVSIRKDDGDDRRCISAPRGGGLDGGGCWKGGGVMSRAGAQDDDAASTLDLLSPGAFKGGVAAMVAVLDKKQQQRRLSGEGGEGGGGGAASPVAAVSNSAKRLAVPVGREDSSLGPQELGMGSQQQQQQQQGPLAQLEGVALPKCFSSSSLLREEGWNFPADLLSSMEANGVLLPTCLQESVWKGGRGSAREDLLVHGRPGDETATAFCVPVLERVLERYPQILAADCGRAGEGGEGEEKAPAWDAEEADSGGGEDKYELVALVLTRTRDMAADITETLKRLGESIPSLSVATLIGGVPVAENRKALLDGLGCNVVVGTPGRVKFLIQEGVLRVSPSTSRMLVLDSADWLMAPVFQDDVGWIARKFPKEKQVLAFSGADPAAYKDGLTALVGSAGLTPIGGIRGGSSEGSSFSGSGSASGSGFYGGGGGGCCSTSTAVILEQGEAAAAALTGAAAAVFAPSRAAAARGGAGAGGGRRQPAGAAASSAGEPTGGGCGGGGEACAPRGTRSPSASDFSPAFAAAGAPRSAAAGAVGAPGARSVVGGVVWPPPSAAAAPAAAAAASSTDDRSRDGGRASPAPSGRRKTSPIRTLGMMREESALRAQGLGWAYGNHVPGTVTPSVGGAPAPAVAAGTSSSTSAMGSPPSFLARGAKGGGGGGKGGVASGGSSTASVSSTGSTFRAKIRSAAENDMYGSWCA